VTVSDSEPIVVPWWPRTATGGSSARPARCSTPSTGAGASICCRTPRPSTARSSCCWATPPSSWVPTNGPRRRSRRRTGTSWQRATSVRRRAARCRARWCSRTRARRCARTRGPHGQGAWSTTTRWAGARPAGSCPTGRTTCWPSTGSPRPWSPPRRVSAWASPPATRTPSCCPA